MRLTYLWLGLFACGGGSHSSEKHDAPVQINDGPRIDATPMSQTTAVLQLHGAASRAGTYIEPSLSHTNAASLHMDTTFTATYTGATFAQALYVDNGGSADLIIAASEANIVTAFSPTGQVVWQNTTLGTPQPMPNPAGGADCGDINPLGITGTPVIDLGSNAIYLDTMVSAGSGLTDAHHLIHALSLASGSDLPGWPLDVSNVITTPTPFLSPVQNQRGGLVIHDGNVYVPYGGHAGDCGDYNGWIVAVPQDDPQHPTSFVTGDTESGTWTPGGLTSDGSNVFGVFGNGTPTSTWGNSEMVARFGSGAAFSGSSSDYWVPSDWMTLDQNDTDLTGPAIPFDLPGSTPEHLIFSTGKDGNAYLLDRDDLGGFQVSPVASLQVASSVIINTTTMYTTGNGLYAAVKATGKGCPGGASGSVVAIKITPGSPPTLSVAWCAASGNVGSPIETSIDGINDPIVWVIGATGDQKLHGFDADLGTVLFDGGSAADAMNSTSEFITPIVAKGRMFVAADNRLYAFTAQ